MNDFKFIDIIDMPSDRNGSLGKLRTDLLRAYNFNRNHEKKMRLLAETLKFVLLNINAGLPELPEEIVVKVAPTEVPKAAVKVVNKPTTRAAKRTTKPTGK